MARRLLNAILVLILSIPPTLVPSPLRAAANDGSTHAGDRALAPNDTSQAAAAGASEFTGDATYEIEIEAPDAGAAPKPRVALQYNSGSRHDSWVGFGWQLSASAIRRSTRQGVPRYIDPEASESLCAVTRDLCSSGCSDSYCLAPDTFELDGQLLVEDPQSAGSYRTERNSGVRIQRGTNSWTVTHPDGRELVYGGESDFRIENPAPPTPGDGATYAWLLASETAPVGSSVEYTYSHDSGYAYLETIEYGAGKNRGISFVPETVERDDQPSAYIAGFSQKLKRRLDRIDVFVKEGTNTTVIRSYDLSYTESQDSFRSLLSGVTVRGLGGAGQPLQTTFEYTTNTGTTDGWSATSQEWPRPYTNIPFSMVVSGQDNGGRLSDLNGDALPDYYYGWPADSSNGVYLNDGTALQPTSLYSFPDYFRPENGQRCDGASTPAPGTPVSVVSTNREPLPVAMADLNGDGRSDFFWRRRFWDNGVLQEATSKPWILLSTEGSWRVEACGLGSTIDDSDFAVQRRAHAGSVQTYGDATAVFADLNGDGLPDGLVKTHEKNETSGLYTIADYVKYNLGEGTFSIAGWYNDVEVVDPTGGGIEEAPGPDVHRAWLLCYGPNLRPWPEQVHQDVGHLHGR